MQHTGRIKRKRERGTTENRLEKERKRWRYWYRERERERERERKRDRAEKTDKKGERCKNGQRQYNRIVRPWTYITRKSLTEKEEKDLNRRMKKG